jgi:hypothetical protein
MIWSRKEEVSGRLSFYLIITSASGKTGLATAMSRNKTLSRASGEAMLKPPYSLTMLA